MSVPPLQPGDVFAGKYRIGRLVAEGVSTLHVVEHVDLGKQCLLQRVAVDDLSALRVEKEAHLWARLASEHGVGLIDEGFQDGTAWIVWERVLGETLRERIERAGPLDPGEARRVIGQLGQALEQLHTQGMVQRDLRPEGILLEQRTSRVRLAGHLHVDRICRGTSAELMGSAVDELSWAAPEQVAAQMPVSPASDVWCFALIAFYALTGLRYWKGTSAVELGVEILADPLPPASARAAELGSKWVLPNGFDAWFGACVCRDAKARITDMDAATRAFLALFPRFEQEILANPKGSFYDDGLQAPPPSQPGGYRGGVHGRSEERRDPVILANPKGSFYDGGLIRNPRRWPYFLIPILVILGVVASILARRH